MKKTMNPDNNRPDNQEGFVLIAALLILLVLTVMGIAVNRGTITEWRIAMNDREQKETFYEADAVTELTAEVLVQNIACMGFNESSAGMVLRGEAMIITFILRGMLLDFGVFMPLAEQRFLRMG